MNNPVFESMIKIMKTYAGKKIFPSEQVVMMRQMWAEHKDTQIHGKLKKQ